MSADLIKLLGEGKSYLWALRHAFQNDPSDDAIETAKSALASLNLDVGVLAAMRQLEYPLARFPYPAATQATFGDFYFFPIPAFDIEIFFKTMICEHGLEMGMELFPSKVDWQFGHDEIQYCIGGDTTVEMIYPNHHTRMAQVRVGDVVAVPNGTNFITHAGEGDGKFGHAHIFLTNVGEQEGQIFYDVGGLLRLQSLGMIAPASGQDRLPFTDIGDRIEVKHFSRLLQVDQNRARDLPTWLCKGWKRRHECRAIDYQEGCRQVVVSSPDREPGDFIEWGRGVRKCYINPLIAERTAAVVDCRFPEGYRRLHAHKELWTVLKGRARLRQSVPPLHGEWVELDVAENSMMVAANGAHIHVMEATDDFVVRRLAETCAHNNTAEMMETKLKLDGVPDNL